MTDMARDRLRDPLDAYAFCVIRRDHLLATSRGRQRDPARTIQITAAASDSVAREATQCLNNEFALRERLHPGWARKPLAIDWHEGGIVLVYPDDSCQTLEAHCAAGGDVARFFALAGAMVRAVQGAHAAGIVHRALAPASFLLSEHGTCRLAGFGQACAAGAAPAGEAALSLAGLSPAYLSPEHREQGLALDARSDLYCLGVILFELATGRLPLTAARPDAIGGWIHAHAASEPALADQVAPAVPAMLSRVLHTLLAKDPRERYPDAAALAADLERCRLAWEAGSAIADFVPARQARAAAPAFPNRLYGRERARAALAAAWTRVRSEGTFGVSVVHGPSGIGKSALIAQLASAAELAGATVIGARADQHDGDAPYAALSRGLRRLVAGMLAQSDAALAHWRGRIAHEVRDPELTFSLVPELAVLLGAPAAAGGAVDSAGRGAAAVLALLRAFAAPGHALLLAVDNAQWLDAATVHLLEQVAGMAAELPVMLLIGVRRAAGASPVQPGDALSRLGARAVYFHEVGLTPLSLASLTRLLADTFGVERRRVAQLASVIRHKTAGNPYFVRQFVDAIVDDRLALHVDGAWTFRIEQIRARGYTDNMVELALRRLAGLPEALRPLLGALACLGQAASLELLCALLATDAGALAAKLAPALHADVLAPDAAGYGFTHERLQEAAYAMLEPDQRQRLHHAIGSLLARQAQHDGRDDSLFRAVEHLAQAPLLVPQAQAAELVALALAAGSKARRACAYESGLAYLGQARRWLAPLAGAQRAALGFEVDLESARCHFLAGQFDACADLVTALLTMPADRTARAQVQSLAVDLEVRRGAYHGAAARALEALRGFGICIPDEPEERACDEAYAMLRAAWGSSPAQVLGALPPLRDPAMTIAFKLLSSLLGAALFTSSRLVFLQVCHTLQLTLRHGIAPESTVSLGWLGVMVCERYRAYADGFGYARMAHALVVRHGYAAHEAQVLLPLDQVSVWTQPLGFALETAQAGFGAARAQGDFTVACYEACHMTCLLLTRGDYLETVRDEIEHALAFVSHVGFADIEAILRTQQGFVDQLRQVRPGAPRATLLQHGGPEADRIGAPMSTLRFWRWLYIAILDFHDGDIDAALAALDQAGALAWSAPAHIHLLDYHLFSVLALCRHAGAAADPAPRARAERHLDQIAAWAASNSLTFRDKHALARGAMCELDGDALGALGCYEQAAAHARVNRFEHIAGIAHESAAVLAQRIGQATAARAHAGQALHAYRRWGALGKVARLEQAFPQALDAGALAGQAAVPGDTIAIRDVDSVIRSLRALSEEIQTEPLVKSLMRIALEHAGAQRSLLIRIKGGDCRIEACATLSAREIEVDLAHAPVSAQLLPLAMLYTVMRTRVPLIVSDSQRPASYALDPYLASLPRCAAIMLPMMKRAQLVGMLYLENRLSSRAFTGEHLQVLALLAAQAAVSLDTAQLYAELVEENRERRRVEKDLRASRATLLLGERISQSGSWTWEVERGQVNCSAELCRLFGFDTAAPRLPFDALIERIHPADRPGVLRLLGDAVSHRHPARFEHRIVERDGTVRYLSVVGEPMGGNDSGIYVGTVSDITRRKADEEALRKAQAELARDARATTVGQLTAAIAHEVNQPLMSISSNAGASLRALRREQPRLDQVRAMLQEIVGQSQRAGKIIHTLQGLAHRSPQLGMLDLHALVRQIMSIAHAELERQEVRVLLELEAGASSIEGDAIQLQQVLLNLVSNAIEALAQVHGRERLLRVGSCTDGDGSIVIRVEDNGVGMGELEIGTAFEPFASHKPGGMGMGLAICRSIIDAHGGQIRAEHVQPHGCRIAFCLPCRATVPGQAP